MLNSRITIVTRPTPRLRCRPHSRRNRPCSVHDMVKPPKGARCSVRGGSLGISTPPAAHHPEASVGGVGLMSGGTMGGTVRFLLANTRQQPQRLIFSFQGTAVTAIPRLDEGPVRIPLPCSTFSFVIRGFLPPNISTATSSPFCLYRARIVDRHSFTTVS